MAINSYPADKKGISNSQWTYTAVGGETTLSGYDSKGQPLSYLVNQEQLFLNGVMLVRNVDYTAFTGTTITGLTALSASDFVEILTYSNFNISTLPATQITGTVQNNQLQNNSIVLGSTTLSLGGTSTSISGLTIDGTNNIIRTNRGATNPTSGQTAGDLFWNTTSSALQLWNGTSWISFAAPNAPTIGTATNIGTNRAFNNAAASVSFTPNLSGGSSTQYFITSTPGSLTAYGTSSPITITGLTSATSYTFTASAVGSFGNSPASDPTGSITATSVPQAPTIGAATGGMASASVAFTPGATGGSSISYYLVTSSPGSITASGASSPINVTGLTAGTAYTFNVSATNANGTSLSSLGSNSVTPTAPPTVTGGTLTSDSTYYYRTFTSNGSLTISNNTLSADVLCIAGGGSGGARVGGGGGAGGIVYSSAQSLAAGTYGLTVGGGATAATQNGATGLSGTTGTSSTFAGLTTAIGGGGGGAYQNFSPTTGGSGGGAGGYNSTATAGAAGTSGQGNTGGNGINGAAGGGGGSSAVGTIGGASGAGGAGGAGTNSYSLWLIAITSAMTGVSGWAAATTTGYIAGGGGGSGDNSGGAGGVGGGGAATTGATTTATSGVTNTGSGGGGVRNSGDASGYLAGSGGSGLVVVRYTKASVGG